MSKPVIAVAFYSTYGHIGSLAEEVIKGVESTGAIAKPFFIKETLPEEVLTKMHAGGSLQPKYPILTPDDLKSVDGLILGCPTRYGRVPAQVSAFFDQCGGLWATGGLVGKFVSMFTSAAGQHGGHEATFITTFPFFAHQGMVYVPIGYQSSELFDISTVQGGAPYGATMVAGGQGERQSNAAELAVAAHQGKYFAEFVGTFVRGKHAISAPSTTTAKQVPSIIEPKTQGYALTAPVAAPTTATPAAVAPVTNEKSVPAETTPAVAAPATTAPGPAAATAAPKKKSGGIFASCCGNQKDLEG